LPKIKEWVDEHDSGATIIPFSADLEQKLSEMSPEEAKVYMKENEFTSMLPKIIRVVIKHCNYNISSLVGKMKLKHGLYRKDQKPPQAAGRVAYRYGKRFYNG
ncbi:Obg-like ATPase 1, partial [Schistosoma japonicum]